MLGGRVSLQHAQGLAGLLHHLVQSMSHSRGDAGASWGKLRPHSDLDCRNKPRASRTSRSTTVRDNSWDTSQHQFVQPPTGGAARREQTSCSITGYMLCLAAHVTTLYQA